MAPLSKVSIGMEPPFHRIFESRGFFWQRSQNEKLCNSNSSSHEAAICIFCPESPNQPTNQPGCAQIFSYRVFLFKSFVKLTPGSTKARFVSCCCRQRTCDDVRQYAEADHIIKNVVEMSELEKFAKGVSDWL